MNPLDESELFKIFKTSTKYPDRLIKREDKNHEFKESFNKAGVTMYLKTMAAFANNEGGYIVFGVKDKPHIMLGLRDKALEQFSTLSVERITQLMQEYFSSDVEWTNCIYEYKNRSFGIIYIYPAKGKPVICKKACDCENKKYSLRESDIYYRYGGKTERIKYPELQRLIDEKRKAEERQWIRFLMKAAHVGVENACILDISKGEISGAGGKIVIDEELIKKISFIKEGEFVEKGGAPTLRLIGNVETIEAGKMVVGNKTKSIVKAIDQTDVVESFLTNEPVVNPLDYIKRICSSSSGYLPVYYYLNRYGKSTEVVIREIEATTNRGPAKKTLLARLRGEKTLDTRRFSEKETEVSLKRKKYVDLWISESIPDFAEGNDDLKTCLVSVQFMDVNQLATHERYIKETILAFYKKFYEASNSNLAQYLRTAICYIDEALNRKPET